ncbi:MAG TPA: hypothetical protein VGH20_14060 [Myxococcales bacterium]
MRLKRLCVALALAIIGCRDRPLAKVAQAPAPLPAPQGTPQRSDVACEAPPDSPSSRVKLRAATGQVRIGVLAGLKDADDENLAVLKKLVAELQRRGADVLLADGDLGDNPDEQETLLGALADSGLPVLAVAGNREVRSDLDAAEAELRKKGAHIIDLSHDRIVELGDATIASLPGTFERRQLHADGACVYSQKDLDALLDALGRAPQPVVLVAALPPRGADKNALDVSEGQNVGDPRLLPLLQRAPFGVFGQVWESGGRAIDGKGKPVAVGIESERLYLNPGAADRTAWPMANGTTASGLAALLTVRGAKASWEKIAAPAATADKR